MTSLRTFIGADAAGPIESGDLITRSALMQPGRSPIEPFLLLAHHGPQVFPPHNKGLPFEPHPHRGFETVTFILDGVLRHQDSRGFAHTVASGGVQWMTAGAGLIHDEYVTSDFVRAGGPLHLMQLWINLPARLKNVAPNYTPLTADEMPRIPLADGKAELRIITGEFAGIETRFRSLTNVFLSLIQVSADCTLTLPAPKGRAVLCYIVDGAVSLSARSIPRWNLLRWADDGDAVQITCAAGTLLLFGHADPIGEPIFAYGPYVMNTEPEIRQALRDEQLGRMGRVSART